MKNAREQWMAEKLGRFGASDLFKLLTGGRRDMTEAELKIEKENKGKRKTIDLLFGDTAMTLINEKIGELLTGQAKEEITGLKASEWGIMQEYDAVELYAEITGEEVTYYGCDNPKFFAYNAFSGASPDAMGTDFNLESKAPFVTSNHIQYLIASKDPENASAWLKENHFDYYVQCQFAQMSCKTERSVFISYDPRMIQEANKLAILKIAKDEELQVDIKHRLNEAGKIIRQTLAILNPPSTILYTPTKQGILVEKI